MIIRSADSRARALVPFMLAGTGERSVKGAASGGALPVLELDKPAGPIGGPEADLDPIGPLLARIAALEDECTRERVAREEAVEAALLEGREQGRHEARDDAAAKLAALQAGIAEAVDRCLAALEGSGDQAVAIARAALRAILGDATERATMVEEAARNAVARAARGRLLRVRVSVEDFPEIETLAVLEQAIGGVSIVRDGTLAGGACLLDMTLGTLDASLAVQAQGVDLALSRFEPEHAEASL